MIEKYRVEANYTG